MNRFLLPLLLIATSISAIAQKQAFNSAYSFGSGLGLDDEVTDAYHQGKYIYTIGYFSGSVDFDPSDDVDLLAVGWEGEDIYFAKYDTLDNLIWVKQLTSETKDEGLGITADKSGNVYICGLFKSKIDLDPSRDTFMLNVHTAGTDGFVAKYDSSGNFKWGYAIGQNRADAVVDIATDNNNNCIITGYFCDTIDIDPGSGSTFIKSSPRKDLFLIQYDSLGNLNWGFSVGNDDLDDVGEVLHVDKLGNIYLSGTFHKTVDFDPSSSSNNLKSTGDKDVFMAKYTKNGAHIWSKHIEGRDDEEVTGMAVNDGKIWLSGEFEGMCDFDPSSSTYYPSFRGYKDVFLSCYDTTGSFNWAHSFGANGAYTYSNGVAADTNGNCYLASFSGDYIDWDPSSKTYNLRGRDDVILSSYSSNGNFRWAHKLGGTKIDKARAVISIGSSVACYGYFDTKAQFDPSNNAPNLLSTGNLISSEGASGFHARYAFNGKYLNAFANTDDLGNSDLVYAVTNDIIGNTYVGGHITGIVDMDHRDNHSHYLDGRGIGKLLLAKYDTSMVLDYAIDFASTGDAQLRDLVVDDSLNLYFTGIFEDTLFLSSKYKGKRIIAKGLNDAIFGKINSKGKLVWIKHIGGTSRTYGHSIDLDSKGNIIISGGFAGNTDFDPSSGTSSKTSSGNYDAFIAKYSNSGALNWVINIGNSEHDFCNDVKVGPTDEIIATGSFQYSCNFNPLGSNVRRTSWGAEDIFICKYNSKGQVQWLRTHGNSQSDIGFALDIDNKGNVYTTGSFSGKTDFDFSGKTHELTPSGRSDIFLLSLDSLGNYKWAHKYGSKSTGSGENGRAIAYNNGRI
ncbi:MAG: SBBP repeat-containing protein, partial [Bacteroidia bacterium]